MTCFEIWNPFDYNAIIERNEIFEKMVTLTVLEKEDIEKIKKLLEPYCEIDCNTIGDFLKAPWQNKEDLKYYFECYSHYYKSIPDEQTLGKMINIYKNYYSNIGPLFRKWYNMFNIKPIYEECLNFKVDLNNISKKQLLDLILELKTLKSKLNEYDKFYNFAGVVEEDLEMLEIIKNKIEEGYIVKGEIL